MINVLMLLGLVCLTIAGFCFHIGLGFTGIGISLLLVAKSINDGQEESRSVNNEPS